MGGDLEALREAALPHPNLADLTQGRTPSGNLADEIENIQMHLVSELPGGRVIVHTYFRGMVMPVAVVSTPAGWRVDVRWWLAAKGEPSEAFVTARMFMYAVISADLGALTELAQPNPALEVLIGTPPPAGEMGQYQHVCEEMPVIELAPGEHYMKPDGSLGTVSVEQCGGSGEDERKVILGQFSGNEIPFFMRRMGGRWRVDPVWMIEARAQSG